MTTETAYLAAVLILSVPPETPLERTMHCAQLAIQTYRPSALRIGHEATARGAAFMLSCVSKPLPPGNISDGISSPAAPPARPDAPPSGGPSDSASGPLS